MTIDDKIRDEKLQYDINREVAKTSALLSGKIDKYEYLTGEDILPHYERSLLFLLYEKILKNKQTNKKTIKDQGEKQLKAIEKN